MEQLTEADVKFGTHGNCRYDWDTILNGNIWKLTRGTDYAVQSTHFRQAAYIAAKNRGLKLQTVIDAKNDSIILRATPKKDWDSATGLIIVDQERGNEHGEANQHADHLKQTHSSSLSSGSIETS